jgi:hypothetical protein
MRRGSLWLAFGIAIGAASALVRGAVRWLAPADGVQPTVERRSGGERRAGGERRSGGERRRERSELVARVGAATERRIDERRSGHERRSGAERRRQRLASRR